MNIKKFPIKTTIIAVIFFAITAAYGLLAPKIWNSPDETAVAYFSELFAGSGRIWVEDGLNFFNGDVLHPRSVISVMGALVPGSFYGQMFVVGAFMKVLGTAALAVATPFFTALAGICIYLFLRKRGEAVGLCGQALFYLMPAVWYFSSRGLFPNVLFVDLAIIAAAVLYLRPFFKLTQGRGSEKLERMVDSLAGGFLLGLAFVIRPVEFLWLAPLAVFAFWFVRKNFRIIDYISFGASFGLLVALFLITNSVIYGGPFSLGYTAGSTAPGIAIPALQATSRLPAWLAAPRPFILPFGFHPRLALVNLFDYLLLYTPWLAVFSVAGFFVVPRRYAKLGLIVLGWLLLVVGIYYGSGIFVDSTIPGLTIGSSYVRYFLPVYLLMVPFAAEAIVFLARAVGERSKNAKAAPALFAGVFLLFGILGAWTVYFRAPESLVPVFKTLTHYAEVKSEVLALTSPGNVIVTERSDKIFFPDRRILLNLRDQTTLDILPKIVFGTETYYYGITLDDADYANIQNELFERKLQLGRVKAFGNETLYSITDAE